MAGQLLIDRQTLRVCVVMQAGGWYILRDWNIVDFDYKSILIQLHVKYGVSPYFRVSVEPNPWSPGSNIITISPSGLGLPDKSYYYQDQDDPIQIAYKQFIRDVVINLSVTRTDAKKFGNDIFYYEKRIAEITPDLFEMTNPVNTRSLIKVSELHYTSMMLPLQDILAAMFPEVNINGHTEVVVVSLNYLSEISRIVAATDSTTLNSYLMWTLVREYLPYLSSHFTATINSFNKDLLGIKQPVPRWETCTNLVYRFEGLAIENILEKQEPTTQATFEIVRNMFESIQSAVKYHIEKYRRTPDFYMHLSKKISGLKIQIKMPQNVLNDTYIKQYYSRLIIMKANLFNSYRNGIDFLKKIEGQQLVSPQPEDIFVNYGLREPFSVSYIPPANTIFIPRALLTEPFFDNKYPSSILYGRLGVQIAKAVVSSVVPFDGGWDANLKLLLPVHFLVNESLRISQKPRKCLAKFLIDNNMVCSVGAEHISLSVLKELSAIKFAYIGLLNSLEKEEHVHQPTLEKFEDDTLFFLTYSQMHCSVLTAQENLYKNKIKFELSQESMLKVAESHYSPLLESLNCYSNTKKKTKCDDIF